MPAGLPQESLAAFPDHPAFMREGSYSYLDGFKIIPGDLGQALDQPRINPRRSLNEGRMTPLWTQHAPFMVLSWPELG